MDCLPTLGEAFALVQNEESHRSVMLPQSSDHSALILSTSHCGKAPGPHRSHSNDGEDKDIPFCDHCNRLRHTRDKYWSLHGLPPMSGGRGRGGYRGGSRGSGPRAHLFSGMDVSQEEGVVPSPLSYGPVSISSADLETLRRIMT